MTIPWSFKEGRPQILNWDWEEPRFEMRHILMLVDLSGHMLNRIICLNSFRKTLGMADKGISNLSESRSKSLMPK